MAIYYKTLVKNVVNTDKLMRATPILSNFITVLNDNSGNFFYKNDQSRVAF